MINKIAIVGTGNVAHHLSNVFVNKGVEITCIASRNLAHANALAIQRNSSASDIESISHDVDLVIISVSDDAVAEVVSKLPKGDFIVTHTSGSISMDIFKIKWKNFGVLYPLQSFSKSRMVDFNEVPILIEGNTTTTTQSLIAFAKRFSPRVVEMDSEKRGKLHLSAVIANNFVNFLATKSYQFLEQNHIDGSLLQPLMKETVARLKKHHPIEMQTGPAKRNDKIVIEKHLKQLESNPKLQSLYRLISQQIIEEYHGGKL